MAFPKIPESFNDKIEKWKIIEEQYHKIFNSKLDEFKQKNEIELQNRILFTHIIGCTEGLFIIREVNNYNSGGILISYTPNNKEGTRKDFNFDKLDHVKFSNKVHFYSLDFFDYDQADNYEVNKNILHDFQMLISNNNMEDDHYIRCVSDVIDINKIRILKEANSYFVVRLMRNGNLLQNYLECLD